MVFHEHFRPFIYFGQFVGLFPYRIELYGKSKRFAFSWFHLLTFWATLSFVLQFLPLDHDERARKTWSPKIDCSSFRNWGRDSICNDHNKS
jgi:hypothetical protein